MAFGKKSTSEKSVVIFSFSVLSSSSSKETGTSGTRVVSESKLSV